MNEARVYADGFERSFAEVKDLLEFLAERGRNAKWIRKPTNTLRLAPLEKEAQNLDAADASMEEILEDTEKNTQLVLKMRGESYPVRDCAIRTILSRAGVNGDGLRKRNILYTGVTRAKSKVYLVGEWAAVCQAIHTDDSGTRNTILSERIVQYYDQYQSEQKLEMEQLKLVV